MALEALDMPESFVEIVPARAAIEARMGWLSLELAIAKRLHNLALKAEQFRELNAQLPPDAMRPFGAEGAARG